MTPCKRAALKKMREELFGLIFVKHFKFASTVRSGAAGIPVLVTRNWCHCGPGRCRLCRRAAHLHLMVFPSIKSRLVWGLRDSLHVLLCKKVNFQGRC